MKEKKKVRTSMWLDLTVMAECDSNLKLCNCRNRSEYISKAIDFYNGYVHSENNVSYLNETIVDSLGGIISTTENRIAKLQFKQAVELAKLSKLVAAAFEVDEETLRQLHIDCVNEVKKINGVIKMTPSNWSD